MQRLSNRGRVWGVATWVALALLGLVVAAAISLAASRLSSQHIGISSEPSSAGQLTPSEDVSNNTPAPAKHPARHHRRHKHSGTQTQSTPAPAPQPVPVVPQPVQPAPTPLQPAPKKQGDDYHRNDGKDDSGGGSGGGHDD